MFRVHEHLEIGTESGSPWINTIGSTPIVGGVDIPDYIIGAVVAERQFALDRAEQMTRWLAIVQTGRVALK